MVFRQFFSLIPTKLRRELQIPFSVSRTAEGFYRAPDTTTINGLGRWSGNTGSPTALAVINAHPGKR